MCVNNYVYFKVFSLKLFCSSMTCTIIPKRTTFAEKNFTGLKLCISAFLGDKDPRPNCQQKEKLGSINMNKMTF